MAVATLEARRLGHSPTPWMPDAYDGEWLAECMACDRWMAYTDDERKPWGHLVSSACSRKAMP